MATDVYEHLNPLDVYRRSIAAKLSAVSGVDEQSIFEALAWTSTLDRGDLLLATPRFRIKDISPADLAIKWALNYPPDELAKSPTAEGVSVRFDFNPETLATTVLPYVFRLGKAYGANPSHGLVDASDPSKGKKTIVIEFSSPNIAKEFHVGHLRSTIIGGFLSHLYEMAGWNVVRLNYLGDWGRQYGLLAIGWQRYGNEVAFRDNPIGHLFEIYVRISADFQPEEDEYKAANKRGEDTSEMEKRGLLGEAKAYFKSMEDGDSAALELWRGFRELSVEKYRATYARLNITFSEYSGESQVKQSTMEEAETLLREKGISFIDKGATIIDFKKLGSPKLDIAIIRNRNGTTNYLLRDVGAAIERAEKYDFDNMIYVVMDEQSMHMQRLFKILELMGGRYAAIAKRLQHVSFGKVMGMSTRRGTARFLDDVLADASAAMHTKMRENPERYAQISDPDSIADTLGISAVVVQDMSGKRINSYPFDIRRMTSLEGDTGPYLQYAHARLCSIARKTHFTTQELATANFSLLREPHAIDLIRLIARYPDMVAQTLKTLEPTTILTYLFRLTHQLSSSYDVLRVVGAPEGEEVSRARAALYDAARQVIANGMELLGLNPLDRM